MFEKVGKDVAKLVRKSGAGPGWTHPHKPVADRFDAVGNLGDLLKALVALEGSSPSGSPARRRSMPWGPGSTRSPTGAPRSSARRGCSLPPTSG